MTQKIKIFIFLLNLVVCQQYKYKKITNPIDKQALCLDGSSPSLYIHQGSEPQNILIYLQGGGFCQGFEEQQLIQHCFQRSLTKFGSSDLWPNQMAGQGILSTNIQQNRFAGWTKIILAYCDSSMYQGHRQEPIVYQNSTLYLRGQKIMKAQLKYIQFNYNLSKAKKLVWSGSSAGAVGAIYWSKYVYNIFLNKQQFYNIIDSGSSSLDIAMHGTHSHLLRAWLKYLYIFTKSQQKDIMNQECVRYYSSKPWKCYLIQYNYIFLKGKFLFIDPLYDSWLISNILNMKCLNFKNNTFIGRLSCNQQEMEVIQKIRNKHIKLLKNIISYSKNTNVWAISCVNHVYINDNTTYKSNSNRVPKQIGLNVKQAIQSFVFEGKRIIAIDQESYPNNQGCIYENSDKNNKQQMIFQQDL